VTASRDALARYAFQMAVLSTAGFEKVDKCRDYIDRHGAEASPEDRVLQTLAKCRELVAAMPEGGGNLSGLVAAAVTAAGAGTALTETSLQAMREYFDSVRAKLGPAAAGEQPAASLASARYVLVFDEKFSAAAGDASSPAALLGAGTRLHELDERVALAEEPVEWAKLGLPAGGRGASGPARNLLTVVVGGGEAGPESLRYLFVPAPAPGGAWSDLDGNGQFDRKDVDLFWKSLAAKPEVWALAVDAAPALALEGAFDALVFQLYQERLIALGDSVNDIDAALREATTRMEAVRPANP